MDLFIFSTPAYSAADAHPHFLRPPLLPPHLPARTNTYPYTIIIIITNQNINSTTVS